MNAADAGAPQPGATASDAKPRRSRSAALVALIPLALAIVAEAAWISVVAGLVQEYALREPTLGIAAFCGFVTAGVLAGRFLGTRLGPRWPPAALAIMALGGGVGWLASAEARSALTDVGLGHALAANAGGWLAALAVLRGYAHARLPLGEQTLTRLLSAGIPGLAIAAVAGGMITEPWRGRFLADALVAAIAFATCATLSLAMARITAVGAASGFDWRRNPAWVGLLVVLVGATAALAIPASFVAGPIISLLVGLAIGPFVMIGLVIGFDRRTVRVLASFIGVAILVFGVLTLIGGGAQVTPPPSGISSGTVEESEPAQALAIGAVLVALAAIVATIIFARLWMRRPSLIDDAVAETRMIDRGEARRPANRPWRPRRAAPVDAVSAYLALNEDLASQPDVQRRPAETPAAHARRLRASGHHELGLDLLVADYALARFAGVRLTPAEDRRGVARWRALRVRLRAPRG